MTERSVALLLSRVAGLACLVAALVALAGCGTTAGAASGARDASVDAAPAEGHDASTPTDGDGAVGDAGAPADADDAGDAPAPLDAGTLALPQVLRFDGGPLAAPRLIAVTFPGDPEGGAIAAFTKAIGGSAYWKAATAEYGVGGAIGDAIVETEAPPGAIDQSNGDAEAWLATRFDGTHPGWGTFDPAAVYLVFYPATTTAIPSVGGCGGAYHQALPIAIGARVDGGVATSGTLLYGVVFRCATSPDVGRPAGLDLTTYMASHEMVEAVTDPFGTAFARTDGAHVAWAYFAGSEVGDMCAFHPGSAIKPADLGFTVQRSWSNAAAAAFLDPCVPGASDPFFVAAPIGESPIVLLNGTVVSEGFPLHVGETLTIDVGFYGAASGAWTVTPFTYAMEHGQAEPNLQFFPPTLSGKSGDVVPLTIRRIAASNDLNGGDAVKLVSALGGATNEWYFAVTD